MLRHNLKSIDLEGSAFLTDLIEGEDCKEKCLTVGASAGFPWF